MRSGIDEIGITPEMLENYEVDHPEPAWRECLYRGDVVIVAEVLAHIRWLDARWRHFRAYVQGKREERKLHYQPN